MLTTNNQDKAVEDAENKKKILNQWVANGFRQIIPEAKSNILRIESEDEALIKISGILEQLCQGQAYTHAGIWHAVLNEL